MKSLHLILEKSRSSACAADMKRKVAASPTKILRTIRFSLFCRVLHSRRFGEKRHHFLGKAADIGNRAAEIDQHVFDPAGAQALDLADDLVGRAENRGLVAQMACLGLVVDKPLAVVAGPDRQAVDPEMPLVT